MIPLLQSEDIQDIKLAVEIINNNSVLNESKILHYLVKIGWGAVNTASFRRGKVDLVRKWVGKRCVELEIDNGRIVFADYDH